jgi:predicted RNase H-like HicB family nuclease
MENKKVTYWQDGVFYLGYANDYPEYITQAYSLQELIDNIKDIISDVDNELVPGKRITEEIYL